VLRELEVTSLLDFLVASLSDFNLCKIKHAVMSYSILCEKLVINYWL